MTVLPQVALWQKGATLASRSLDVRAAVYDHAHLRRIFSIGNSNAVCMEGPFLHAFDFAKFDFRQVCCLQLICGFDFH
jgi:hypothetical protein